ncbi:FmdB family zinc ribbon protein [Oligoflexus tunisiensis]|uniref:FmdB family zinc ribbon protein n=1 Tax=Oligoflexus tunisiensis TaxID=708132 RepID=UPI00114D1777
MPVYDVQCSACGYEGTATIMMNDLSGWDQKALCPSCEEGSSKYRRIIKKAPSSIGHARPKAQSKSSDLDDMRHKGFKRKDPDQVAAAVESVRKGEFEGF